MEKNFNPQEWFQVGKGYLDLGWSIIPIGQDKKPLCSWKRYQAQHPTQEELKNWCNIKSLKGFAVVTGQLSGIYVLDIDNGSEFDIDRLPQTPHSKTGSGGHHLYFIFPENESLRNSGGFQPFTDTRGEGGYAVLPPSIHPSGTLYAWLVSPFSTPLAPVPNWLIEELRKPTNNTKISNNDKNIFEGVEESKRNDSATRVVGKILHQFKQEDWDTEGWPLVQAWNLKNNPPLDEKELRTAFDSIKQNELAKKSSKSSKQASQADSIVGLIFESNVNVFRNQNNETFISLPNSDFIAEPLNSKNTETLLFKLFWEKYGKVPGQKAVSEAINTLRGHARFNNPQTHDVHNRIGRQDNTLYYDVGDNKHVVHISENGWEIRTDSPIVFQRHAHQQVQVLPQKGGDLKEILPLINITDEASKLLFLTHLITCFIPDIPRAAFALSGAPGSAKSTLLRMMRKLIDPSATPLLTHNPDPKELIQIASHQYVVFLDNLSYLPEKLSDDLCRFVTGDAFSKRELYTNDSDVLYAFMRAVGFCGVNLVATKPDLLSRCVIIKLDLIPGDKRIEERVVLDNFEKLRPFLLGAIFDGLSYCLRIASSLELKTLPRMADHFRYSAAASLFLGYTVNDLYSASKLNSKNQNEEAIEMSPVAQAVVQFMVDKDSWDGTSTQFYEELQEIADNQNIRLPKLTWITRKLNEVRHNLLEVGILIEPGRSGNANKVEVTKTKNTAEDQLRELLGEEPDGSMEAVEAEIDV